MPTLPEHKRILPPTPERSHTQSYMLAQFVVNHSQPQFQDRWHCHLYKLEAFQKYPWKTTAIPALTSAQLLFLGRGWKGCHSCWQRSGQSSQWDVDKWTSKQVLCRALISFGPHRRVRNTPTPFFCFFDLEHLENGQNIMFFLPQNNSSRPQSQYPSLSLSGATEFYHVACRSLCRMSMVLTNIATHNMWQQTVFYGCEYRGSYHKPSLTFFYAH